MLQLSKGRAMNVITSTFEELGYSWAYRVVDSRSFGLPQRRRRVFLVASRTGDPRTVLFADEHESSERDGKIGTVACGFYWTEGNRGLGWAIDATPTLKGGSGLGIPSAPAIVFPSGLIATPHIKDAERLQGFPADWTKPMEKKGRSNERWRLVGNAVTVRSAHWIGRRLANPGAVLEFETSKLRRAERWPAAAWNVGKGRLAVSASEWPVQRKYLALADFLRFEPIPLSAKATKGFLERVENSGLRTDPKFVPALRAHLKRVLKNEAITK